MTSYLLLIEEQSAENFSIFRLATATNVNETLKSLQNGNHRNLKILAQLSFEKNDERPNQVMKYLGVVLGQYQLVMDWFRVPRDVIAGVMNQVNALRKSRIPLRGWKINPEPMTENEISQTLPRYPRGSKIQVDIYGNLHVGKTPVSKVLSRHVQQALEKYSSEAPAPHNIVLLTT